MRLGGRLQAAIEVLTDIETRHRPVPEALKDWGASHRFAGSGDRAAISNLVHDALRMKLSHGFLMDGDTPADLAVATLLRQWNISPEELTSSLDGDKFAPEIPSVGVLAACLGRDLSAAPAHVRADIPEWLAGSFERAFDADWEAEAQAMAARPPLDLRANTLMAERDQVLAEFNAHGARPTRLAPNGIRIEASEGPKRQIAATGEVCFTRGWFEIQDEGSQLAAGLAGAAAGEKVLDYCAGGGGKSLAFAAMMGNEGSINAYDADRRRLAPMVERIGRAGAEIIYIKDRVAKLSGLEGRMDRVLIDAPCTGTGTWRRRPDAKWRISEKNISDRIADQDQVLDDASLYVRPGGELAYVTCSLLPEENTDRVKAFLQRHPEFETISLKQRWRSAVADPDAPVPYAVSNLGLLLSPRRTGTDGFYFAGFRRKM
ncbi:RsmB/NOP family class I SAM-dependent RNA methyltransferase [Hoeflea sp. YIM 152468]|uniref:RsmB/NOP family class I SAM-dependent RNA methyltransferase n=1 Tax=Hoeflea sp. YIM 152468 TaxID=3031759 RepID=UPI0023DB681C|nr:RsmB/NOP family class I SAM-dependent RNA methyltransferase [Hoeflea sp. YIM 152468]MDF1610407.1 RsmB/NOP family class I SAM-dependent RNA methyltransferase [Hoeflea sp. YIM 152468]